MVICPWNMDHIVNGLLEKWRQREVLRNFLLCGRKGGNKYKYKAGFWEQKSVPEVPCQETRCCHIIYCQLESQLIAGQDVFIAVSCTSQRQEGDLSQLSLTSSTHHLFFSLTSACDHPDLTRMVHSNQEKCRNGVNLSKLWVWSFLEPRNGSYLRVLWLLLLLDTA